MMRVEDFMRDCAASGRTEHDQHGDEQGPGNWPTQGP
jgi:hypothetical protein